MTVAVAVKVNSGIVLAADSAASSYIGDARNQRVYNNASKIVNLDKRLPLAATLSGAGSIGPLSMDTVFKAFREERHSRDVESGYKVKDLATDLAAYLDTTMDRHVSVDRAHISLDAFVAGFSEGEELPELFKFGVENGVLSAPREVFSQNDGSGGYGIEVLGDPRAATRLLNGIDMFLVQGLMANGVFTPQNEQRVADVQSQSRSVFFESFAPIQDMIELAEYLVETTKGFHRFTRGASTVDGPTDIATITRFENFKWVRRKHFYDSELNPPFVKHLMQEYVADALKKEREHGNQNEIDQRSKSDAEG